MLVVFTVLTDYHGFVLLFFQGFLTKQIREQDMLLYSFV